MSIGNRTYGSFDWT